MYNIYFVGFVAGNGYLWFNGLPRSRVARAFRTAGKWALYGGPTRRTGKITGEYSISPRRMMPSVDLSCLLPYRHFYFGSLLIPVSVSPSEHLWVSSIHRSVARWKSRYQRLCTKNTKRIWNFNHPLTRAESCNQVTSSSLETTGSTFPRRI